MSIFSAAEIEYLQSQRLGRLATVNDKGDLHPEEGKVHYHSRKVK